MAGTDQEDSAPRSSTTGCIRPRQGFNRIDATAKQSTRQASGTCRQSCRQTRVLDTQEEAALGAEGAPSRRQGSEQAPTSTTAPAPVNRQQPEPSRAEVSSVRGLSHPWPRQVQTQGPTTLATSCPAAPQVPVRLCLKMESWPHSEPCCKSSTPHH